MFNQFFESLESREFMSVTLPAADTYAPAATTAALAVAEIAPLATLPRLVGIYTGNLSIPAVGHNRSVTMTISKQAANGKFTGKLVSSGVTVAVSGVVSAKGTFTIALRGSHVGGTINGTGTGKLVGKKATVSLNFSPGGKGSMRLTKA